MFAKGIVDEVSDLVEIHNNESIEVHINLKTFLIYKEFISDHLYIQLWLDKASNKEGNLFPITKIYYGETLYVLE